VFRGVREGFCGLYPIATPSAALEWLHRHGRCMPTLIEPTRRLTCTSCAGIHHTLIGTFRGPHEVVGVRLRQIVTDTSVDLIPHTVAG
jgi:hypothetical protein